LSSSLLGGIQAELFYQKPESFFEYIWKVRKYSLTNDQKQLWDAVFKSKADRMLVCSGNGVGKTLNFATIGLDWATVQANRIGVGVKVLIISGSWTQAQNTQDYVNEGAKTPYVKAQIDGPPSKTRINFKNGSYVQSVTASDYQVLGKHVDVLLVDEAAMIPETIMNDCFSRLVGSNIGLLAIASTPEPKFYFSKFVKMWEDKREYPENKWLRFSWKTTDCPWVQVSEVEQAQRLSKAEYQSKWLGVPTFEKSSNVFPYDELKECIKEKVEFCKDLDSVAGYDFGFHQPPALVIQQKDGDCNFIVFNKEYGEMPWSKQLIELQLEIPKHNVTTIYCDSTRPELIADLRTQLPCRVFGVPFKTHKPALQVVASRLVTEMRLRIPQSAEKLVREMAVYMTDTNKNDDLVDAMMLSLKEETQVNKQWTFQMNKQQNNTTKDAKKDKSFEFISRDILRRENDYDDYDEEREN